MAKNVILSEKQILAVELLMQNLSIAKVAEQIGVNRVSVYRWLKDDNFQKELTNKKSEIIEGVSRKLAGALDKSVQVLIELRDSCKQPNIRRLSSMAVIDYTLKISEMTDLESRIKVLEAAIDKK